MLTDQDFKDFGFRKDGQKYIRMVSNTTVVIYDASHTLEISGVLTTRIVKSRKDMAAVLWAVGAEPEHIVIKYNEPIDPKVHGFECRGNYWVKSCGKYAIKLQQKNDWQLSLLLWGTETLHPTQLATREQLEAALEVVVNA